MLSIYHKNGVFGFWYPNGNHEFNATVLRDNNVDTRKGSMLIDEKIARVLPGKNHSHSFIVPNNNYSN